MVTLQVRASSPQEAAPEYTHTTQTYTHKQKHIAHSASHPYHVWNHSHHAWHTYPTRRHRQAHVSVRACECVHAYVPHLPELSAVAIFNQVNEGYKDIIQPMGVVCLGIGEQVVRCVAVEPLHLYTRMHIRTHEHFRSFVLSCCM